MEGSLGLLPTTEVSFAIATLALAACLTVENVEVDRGAPFARIRLC